MRTKTVDKVYFISATINNPSSDGNMYVQATAPIGIAVLNISEAKVFHSEDEAREFLVTNGYPSGWAVTPMDRKKVFKRKLQ